MLKKRYRLGFAFGKFEHRTRELGYVFLLGGVVTTLQLGISGKSGDLIVGTGVGSLLLVIVMMTLLYLLSNS